MLNCNAYLSNLVFATTCLHRIYFAVPTPLPLHPSPYNDSSCHKCMFQICCTLPPHSIFTDVVNWMHPASSSFCPRKFCMVCIYLSNLLLYWPCTLWFLNFRLLLSTRRLPATTCLHRIYFAVPTPLPLHPSPYNDSSCHKCMFQICCTLRLPSPNPFNFHGCCKLDAPLFLLLLQRP